MGAPYSECGRIIAVNNVRNIFLSRCTSTQRTYPDGTSIVSSRIAYPSLVKRLLLNLSLKNLVVVAVKK